jgi:hypothetical protein
LSRRQGFHPVPIRKAQGIAPTLHGTPNDGGTPCFDIFSLLWQHSFSSPQASFPMKRLHDAEVAAVAVCARAAFMAVVRASAPRGAAADTRLQAADMSVAAGTDIVRSPVAP